MEIANLYAKICGNRKAERMLVFLSCLALFVASFSEYTALPIIDFIFLINCKLSSI